MPLPTYPPVNNLRYSPFVIPESFREIMSYEDQLHWIVYHIWYLQNEHDELDLDFVSTEDFKNFIAANELAHEELKNYTDDEIDELRRWVVRYVGELTVENIRVVDPSTGFVSGLNDSLSHLYNDLRYWAMTWDEWDTFNSALTWDSLESQLSQYTVKQIDLLGAQLLLDEQEPRAETLPQDEVVPDFFSGEITKEYIDESEEVIDQKIEDMAVKIMVYENYEGFLGQADPRTIVPEADITLGRLWYNGNVGDPIGTVWPTAKVWYGPSAGWVDDPNGGDWTVAEGDLAYWQTTDYPDNSSKKYAAFAVDKWIFSNDFNPIG